MKILVLALSGIGDALMFTPALKLVKEKYPFAEIDALIMFKAVKDIYERTNIFNNIYYFDFLNEGKAKGIKYILGLRGKYDYSINVYPSNRKEYNLVNFIIGAKHRAGTKYLRMDNQNFGFLNNRRFTEDDSLHNVQENIKLCEKLFNTKFNGEPGLLFPLTQTDLSFAEQYFIKLNISKEDFVIGFHSGCATLKNHIKRRWEPEKFAELGRQLIDTYKAKILIFGGPDEKDLKENVLKQINSNNAYSVDENNLARSAAIMRRCNLFITNDSSLMHIAASQKLKIIAIIGPTNTNYIHPWHTEHRIVTLNLECSPCFFYSPKPLTCIRTDVKFKCIKELTVNMVAKEVEKLLIPE
jgi:heptosyltransferase-2